MRVAAVGFLALVLVSCNKNTHAQETETVESYRFMYGALAADFCITSLHLLALDRKNLEQGTFEQHDRAVLMDNEAALKRLKADFEKSLRTMYADDQRRARDRAAVPLFDLTITCHELFLQYVDARSAENQAKYLSCQQRFSGLLQDLLSPGGLKKE